MPALDSAVLQLYHELYAIISYHHIYEAIDHPSFGLCMDPGNVIFYTAEATVVGNLDGHRLPTDTLSDIAHCFNTLIVKDCVVDQAGSPNA